MTTYVQEGYMCQNQRRVRAVLLNESAEARELFCGWLLVILWVIAQTILERLE